MRVLVIGLGSMGKRRIRLIKNIAENIEIIGVDARDERRKHAEEELGIRCENDLQTALEDRDIEAAFVCTSPLSHYPIIKELLRANLDIFTEINLSSEGYSELCRKANEKNKILFLSSTFLYRKDLQKVMEIVEKTQGKVGYIYHTGQYLPDWHPWEKIGDYFVSQKESNGCREIMAIEFPWIEQCFGEFAQIDVRKDKLSTLEIDYCDTYFLTIQHKNGNKGTMIVDVVSRKASRVLEVFGEDIHLRWGGTPDSLRGYDIDKKEEFVIETYKGISHDDRYSPSIIEDAYEEEIRVFFESRKKRKDIGRYSFEKDQKVLDWIDYIEGDK